MNLPMHRRWTSTACASSTLEGFLDEKSGGYQIQTSELATPEALERLILAIATLPALASRRAIGEKNDVDFPIAV